MTVEPIQQDDDRGECLVTRRRARRQHRCDKCRKPIMPGQEYNKYALPPDSDIGNIGWWTMKCHLPADCPLTR